MNLNSDEHILHHSTDVLVVENDKLIQKQIEIYLKEYDIDFKLLQSSPEAIKLLKQATFNLILLDIDATEYNAFDLTKKLRTELEIDIPVVATTYSQIDEIKDACFDAGMNACLQKPICKVEMFGVLTQFLPKEKLCSGNKSRYKVINLSYLHEISMGDVEFEQEITQRFLEVIDVDLLALSKHFKQKDFAALKKDAHRTLSTIYVMGLSPLLEPHLKAIEHEDLSEGEINNRLTIILNTCSLAKADAMLFLSTLRV